MGSFISNQEGWLNWAVDGNEVSSNTSNEEIVSQYTTNWLYANLSGILIQPLCGFVLDKIIKKVALQFNMNSGKATIMVTPFSMTFCSILWISQSFLMTIREIGWITWLIYIIYVVQRLYVSVSNMYVLSNNADQFSGRVLAVISMLTIGVSLLQPVATSSVTNHDDDYGLMNRKIGYLSVGSLIFPALLYIEKYVKSFDR